MRKTCFTRAFLHLALTHIRAYAYKHTYAFTHMLMHSNTITPLHTHSHTLTHAHFFYLISLSSPQSHMFIQAHTNSHTYAHMLTRTYALDVCATLEPDPMSAFES